MDTALSLLLIMLRPPEVDIFSKEEVLDSTKLEPPIELNWSCILSKYISLGYNHKWKFGSMLIHFSIALETA